LVSAHLLETSQEWSERLYLRMEEEAEDDPKQANAVAYCGWSLAPGFALTDQAPATNKKQQLP